MTPAEARDLALKKLQDREPVTGEAQVRLASKPVERLALAQVALDEAEATTYTSDTEKTAAVEQARAELAAAQEQVDDSTITFTFESIAPVAFDKLLEDHPPSDEEIEQAKARGDAAPQYGRSFRPALVAATCTFPGFSSPGEADDYLWEGKGRLTRSEADDMFLIAWSVCLGRREVVDWGKDFARTRG